MMNYQRLGLGSSAVLFTDGRAKKPENIYAFPPTGPAAENVAFV